MEQNIVDRPQPSDGRVKAADIALMAEEGASLSSGALRLYALPYGCVDLYNYDPLNRRCAVGIVVATAYRRQGCALAMLQALRAMYSSPQSLLHCLYADIAAANTASLALFRKAGYTECGRFAQWLCTADGWMDAVRMQQITEP